MIVHLYRDMDVASHIVWCDSQSATYRVKRASYAASEVTCHRCLRFAAEYGSRASTRLRLLEADPALQDASKEGKS